MQPMTEQEREYNQRQYHLMQRAVQQYESDAISLGQLVDTLEALNSALLSPSESWLSEFEPAWGKLEDVYAGLMDEGDRQFDDIDRRLVGEAVIKLASLIQSKLVAE